MGAVTWDPQQYERYADERSRPFHDLVARVAPAAGPGPFEPGHVVDLGCGDGALTATLAERWPAAYVEGVDSSADMLAACAPHAVPGRVEFREGDAASWTPSGPLDLLVSNATLQWVPDHLELLSRYVGWLRPGGVLAVQVPGNHAAPAHALLRELRTSPRWRDQVGEGADRHLAVADPAGYLERLAGLGCTVDAWETTYLHVLPGEDAVLDWIRGTGLRPVLSRLDGAEQEEFLAAYGARLREAFPRRPWGTVLPFRRVFFVARRTG